jgi:hypothetical protein
MAGELMSELRGVLKRKSPAMNDDPVLLRIGTSSLIVTTGSHDSGPALSSGDIATSHEDILALDELFRCVDCGTLVSVERHVVHEDKAYCKCGRKHIPWKR